MTSKKEFPQQKLSKEEFKALVMDYFYAVDKSATKKYYNVPGLAQHLDWDTDDLIDFPTTHKFYPVIKVAKQRIEEYLVDKMMSGSIDKTVGVFMLKNHFGYKEKVDGLKTGAEKKTISEILDQL